MASLLDSAFDFIDGIENCKCMSDYDPQTKTFTAYPDGKRYSIGFGSLAKYPTEVITLDQAIVRAKDYIKWQISDFDQYSWFNAMNTGQKIAVLSYAYQWGNQGFLNSRFYELIKEGASKSQMLAWAESQKLYTKRRIAEVNSYWNEPNSSYILLWLLIGVCLLRKCF